MAENGREWPRMAENGREWPGIAGNGRGWPVSWVFENYFKQIQNQQEAGIQDGIRSPCSQIVSQNL